MIEQTNLLVEQYKAKHNGQYIIFPTRGGRFACRMEHVWKGFKDGVTIGKKTKQSFKLYGIFKGLFDGGCGGR